MRLGLIFTNTRNLAERLTWALRRRFPERAEVNVKHRAGHHADPTREHVRPEAHGGEAVKIIADAERHDRREPQEKNQLCTFSTNRAIDPAKLLVPLRYRFDFVARDETGDEEGQRRAEG